MSLIDALTDAYECSIYVVTLEASLLAGVTVVCSGSSMIDGRFYAKRNRTQRPGFQLTIIFHNRRGYH